MRFEMFYIVFNGILYCMFLDLLKLIQIHLVERIYAACYVDISIVGMNDIVVLEHRYVQRKSYYGETRTLILIPCLHSSFANTRIRHSALLQIFSTLCD